MDPWGFSFLHGNKHLYYQLNFKNTVVVFRKRKCIEGIHLVRLSLLKDVAVITMGHLVHLLIPRNMYIAEGLCPRQSLLMLAPDRSTFWICCGMEGQSTLSPEQKGRKIPLGIKDRCFLVCKYILYIKRIIIFFL